MIVRNYDVQTNLIFDSNVLPCVFKRFLRWETIVNEHGNCLLLARFMAHWEAKGGLEG